MLISARIVLCFSLISFSSFVLLGQTNMNNNSVDFRTYSTHKEFKKNKGKLLDGSVTIVLGYRAISCECAQWIEEKDSLANERSEVPIFLEPANKNIVNPDTLWSGERLPFKILVTGQFYSGIGFPNKYKPIKGNPSSARVFKYNAVKIISN